MNKQTACGKAAKRTPGYGVQSMSVAAMKEFIKTEGTLAAKGALSALKGNPARGDLCGIFHMFARGREEIAKGEGMRNYKFSPSSNARRSPVRSPVRRSPMRSMSSPNFSPARLLKIAAFMQGRNKRMLKRVLKAMPKRLNYLKPRNEYMYGVKVLTGRPTRGGNQRYSNGNNGSRGNNGSYNNNNHFGKKNVHFKRGGFNNARNVVVKRAPAKKTSKKFLFNTVSAERAKYFKVMKPENKGVRYYPKNNSPTSSEKRRMKPKVANRFVNFLAQTKNVRKGVYNRVPTRPRVQAPGTRAHASNARLNNAARASRNKFTKAVSPKMSPSQQAALANKLLLKEIFGSNSPPPPRARVNFPQNAPPSPKKRGAKYSTKLSKKLAGMARKVKSRAGFRAVNMTVAKRPMNYGRGSSSNSGSGSGSRKSNSGSGSGSSANKKSPKQNQGFLQRIRNARVRALKNRQNYLNKKK